MNEYRLAPHVRAGGGWETSGPASLMAAVIGQPATTVPDAQIALFPAAGSSYRCWGTLRMATNGDNRMAVDIRQTQLAGDGVRHGSRKPWRFNRRGLLHDDTER